MNNITYRQDVMGRPGRKVQDMRPAARGGGAPFPWSKVSFGYKVNPDGDNPAEVKIYDGQIITDNTAREPVVVTHTPFVISGTQVIYVQADVNNVSGTAELTTTHSTSLDYRYFRLYEFTESGGSIDDSLTKIYRPFDIESGFDGSDIPDGTEANPHLIWNVSTGLWAIGVIVPPGSESFPYLHWDTANGCWETVNLFELPGGGDDFNLLSWDPEQQEWVVLPCYAEDQYKVVTLTSTGQPIIDYVRCHA